MIENNAHFGRWEEPTGDRAEDLLSALELIHNKSQLSPSERVFLGKGGIYLYKDFADNTKAQSLRNLVFAAVAHLQGLERLQAKQALYKRIEAHSPTISLGSVGKGASTHTSKPKKNKVTEDYSPEFVAWFANRGISAQALRLCGVAQLLERNRYQFREPVALYPTGQARRLFETQKDKKRFYTEPQLQGSELFGHVYQDQPKTLVFEGETDTLLAISLGFSALCLGGVARFAKLKEQQGEKGQFVLCSDFDNAGAKLRELASSEGYVCASVADFEQFCKFLEEPQLRAKKDICEVWQYIFKGGNDGSEQAEKESRDLANYFTSVLLRTFANPQKRKA